MIINDNLTWADEIEGVWKGWTYSRSRNRYFFDDVGNESIAELWNDPFLNQAFESEGEK
jgi:hypothetical protein